ncbi:hypothetical protein [Gloeomargarita sp.]
MPGNASPLPPLYQQMWAYCQRFSQGDQATAQLASLPELLTTWIDQLPTTLANLPAPARACGVEIHKHLHLLRQEWLFWQAARQPATQTQRWQQVQQRLTTLKTHLHTFSQLLASPEQQAEG